MSVSNLLPSASARAGRSDSRGSTSAGRESPRAEVDITPQQTTHWFPAWGPALIMLGVAVTGFILGLQSNQVPHIFFVLFALAALAVTVLVEPRALFLTVASLPLYYLVSSALIGWNVSSSPAGTSQRRTKIIHAFYPAVEHYLWLLVPFILACLIAAARWWFYRDALTRSITQAEFQRRRLAHAERTNRERYNKVRQRTHSSGDPARSSTASSSPKAASKSSLQAERSAQRRTTRRASRDSHAAPSGMTPHTRQTPAPSQQLPQSQPQSRQRSTPEQPSRPLNTRYQNATHLSTEELRKASQERQRRRDPLPERRQPPRHYIKDLKPSERQEYQPRRYRNDSDR